jgi:hypothetical protein
LWNPQSTQSAAFHHRFLVSAIGSHFIRSKIDSLQDSALMDLTFPGYPREMASDTNLWRNYFAREFETKVSSSTLSLPGLEGQGSAIHESWTGCLDILRDYGADILIVGASDTAQSLPPDELAKYFPNQRILMCASPSLTVDATREFLQLVAEISSRVRPIRWVIFGMSTTLSFTPSIYYPAINRGKIEMLEAYRRKNFLGRYSFLNNRLSLPVSWNDILPVRRDVQHVPLPNRQERKKNRPDNPERWSIFSFTMTPSELKDEARVQELRREHAPTAYFFSGDQDPSCVRLQELRGQWQQIRDLSNQLAAHSLFFFNPTLGDELRQAPACYLPELDRFLSELQNAQTGIIPRTDFGVPVADFAFRERLDRPLELKLDMAHVNISGARKITEAVAEFMMRTQ